MSADAPTRRAHLAGDGALAAALAERGVEPGEPGDGLVFDASGLAPASWGELEDELTRVFALTQAARANAAPVVYALDGPSLYGHADPLRAMLATGLLGGARSVAVEGRRSGMAGSAVVLDDPRDAGAAADAVLHLLAHRELSGQVLQCGATHFGRPPA